MIKHSYEYAIIVLRGIDVVIVQWSNEARLTEAMQEALIRQHDPLNERVLFRDGIGQFYGPNMLLNLIPRFIDTSKWDWEKASFTVSN